MKIGIFDPYLDTLAGGEKYMLSIATCLAENHEVVIFWDKQTESDIREKIKKKFALDISNISFVSNIFGKNTSFFKRLRESSKFDYIILLSDGSIPYLNTNTILHFQSPMEWVKVHSIKNKMKFHKIKHIICNSGFTKMYIDKKFSIRSKVIYPPVATKNAGSINKENIILNVGRFGINHAGSSFKKQDVMIDVFKSMIREGIKDWKFVLVVSTLSAEEKKQLEKLKISVADFPIEIIENPENEMLWQMYSRAKIYWHAAGFGEDLEIHPDRAEHFGIATVEAMGMGAVPVVIEAGGQREIVTDSKDGYLWRTREELVEKTKKLLEHDELRKDLAVEAKKRAEDFSYEKFCERVNGLLA